MEPTRRTTSIMKFHTNVYRPFAGHLVKFQNDLQLSSQKKKVPLKCSKLE